MKRIVVLLIAMLVLPCAIAGALSVNLGGNDMDQSDAVADSPPAQTEIFPDPTRKDLTVGPVTASCNVAGGGLTTKDFATFPADLQFGVYPSSALNGRVDANRSSDGTAAVADKSVAPEAASSDVVGESKSTVELQDVAKFVEGSASGGNVTQKNFSAAEPMASSGPPVPTPLAGWISLVGLLGVVVLRWFSLARRFWAAAARD